MSNAYVFSAIAIMSAVTIFTRGLPFFVFSGKRRVPKIIYYLGEALPPAIISMLVVYCLRKVSVTEYPFGIPELIASAAVVLLHVWRRNNLISIFGGTILYMVLVQAVFV